MPEISTSVSSLGTRPSRKPKQSQSNPIETAVRSWFETLPAELLASPAFCEAPLISSIPKRWVAYPPMVLLPSGSFGPVWEESLPASINEIHRNVLWKNILTQIGKREGKGALTHLAINSGIPLHQDLGRDEETDGREAGAMENILRTPSGLTMLYGDFGPSLSPDVTPTARDFSEAFWVSTKQNGITQIWAPHYTMFSRGNIKEKARLLDFHKDASEFPLRKSSKQDLGDAMAVDLYAGIGYFVFSYVAMGLGRVLGWELNPWSVEGLRRGAIANGWSVKIVDTQHSTDIADSNEKIVVFLENNERALDRIHSMAESKMTEKQAIHVNGGLLPTSVEVWRDALNILGEEGWLHLHENVGVADIQKRRLEIESIFTGWSEGRRPKVEHVELVKTFAPGVWHCVFDVFIGKSR